MRESDDMILQHYGDYVTSALQTEGGHLSIGRGGFTLYYARGARLSGYDCESFKTCCIAAGLPVIDSRMVAFEDVVRLAVRGPMVAVGEEARLRNFSGSMLLAIGNVFVRMTASIPHSPWRLPDRTEPSSRTAGAPIPVSYGHFRC